ncbi:MAG: TadE family protein [Dehalococcoidia bacterium]
MASNHAMGQEAGAMTKAIAARQRAPGSTRRGSQRGQSLVEFALVMPVLLILVLGIMEFGFAITDQISVTNAARDGARAGALKGGSAAAAITQAQHSASGLISCPLLTPTATYSGGTPNEVTVDVQCNYAPVTPLGQLVKLFGGTLGTAFSLNGQVVMRVEQ